MDKTHHLRKPFIYFTHTNPYDCLDVQYELACSNVSFGQMPFVDQQDRTRFLQLHATWAHDQRNLPPTVQQQNCKLLKQYAKKDNEIAKANNEALQEGIKRSLDTRLEEINNTLLRVGIKRSLATDQHQYYQSFFSI